MVRLLIATLAFALAASGCNPSKPEGPPLNAQNPEGIQEVEDAADLADKEQIVGEYYEGDRMVYNLALSMTADSKFSWTLSGCVGIFGKAEGTWKVHSGVVTFTTVKETDLLKGYLKQADVVKYQGHTLMVLERDKDLYQRHGPFRLWCLHKPEAEAALTRHQALNRMFSSVD